MVDRPRLRAARLARLWARDRADVVLRAGQSRAPGRPTRPDDRPPALRPGAVRACRPSAHDW